MKVRELINRLSNFDPDMDVMVMSATAVADMRIQKLEDGPTKYVMPDQALVVVIGVPADAPLGVSLKSYGFGDELDHEKKG